MIERFEEIFGEVMEEEKAEWWELFDSEEFSIVEERIEAEFGSEVFKSKEWSSWIHEMSMEL